MLSEVGKGVPLDGVVVAPELLVAAWFCSLGNAVEDCPGCVAAACVVTGSMLLDAGELPVPASPDLTLAGSAALS